jgi:putative ATP-binding cassette transporter
MFVSQLPYVPLGDLRGVVSYPNSSGDISDDALRDALNKVALAPLTHRFDEEQDWAKVLSPVEQQRIFARIRARALMRLSCRVRSGAGS